MSAFDATEELSEPLERVASIARAVTPLDETPDDPTGEDAVVPGTRFGAWRIVGPLGRGGMSRVFVAERAEGGFSQRAALKLFDAGAGLGGELARRFQQERQLLASLEHPNIARVLDGGVGERGRPFLVLELVEGQAIDLWCEERSLGARERAALLVAAARAVQHAHRNLVVHRDIKPSNLLVTHQGAVKLLDFGIAKVLDGSKALGGALAAPETRTTARPLTPAYASPEQVRGLPVTTASDVYQLGLLLYELLAGRRAHRFREDSWRELDRVVCEVDPARLSRQGNSRESGTSTVDVPSDLETIVFKALAKDPLRRYGSAEQFAEDLERFLADQPVLARSDTLTYRVRKFVRRHRAATAIAATLALLVSGAAVALGVLSLQLRDERDRVRREARKAQTVSSFVSELFEANDPLESAGVPLSARDLLDRGAARLSSELDSEPELLAEMLSRVADMNLRLGRPTEAESLALRAVEAAERARLPESELLATPLRLLGNARVALGRPREAEADLRRALELRSRSPQANPTGQAEILLDWSDALLALGFTEKAHRAALDAVGLLEADRTAPAARLAHALQTLAEVEHDRLDYAAAESSARRALALIESTYGASSPRVARSLNSLARALESRGNFAEAEAMLRRSLELRRRIYGDAHSATATGLHNLARVTAARGDLDGAVQLGEEALAIRERVQGRTHPETVVTRTNLARHERERLHLERALALLEQSVSDLRIAQSGDPKLIRNTEVTLGLVLLDMDRVDEASRWIARAEEILASEAERDHPLAELFLGRSAEARGDPVGASAHFERAASSRFDSSRNVREARLRLELARQAVSREDDPGPALVEARRALEPLSLRLLRLVEGGVRRGHEPAKAR